MSDREDFRDYPEERLEEVPIDERPTAHDKLMEAYQRLGRKIDLLIIRKRYSQPS